VTWLADCAGSHFQDAGIRPPLPHQTGKVCRRKLGFCFGAAGVNDERLAVVGQIPRFLEELFLLPKNGGSTA
jgi:hypothetical protein